MATEPLMTKETKEGTASTASELVIGRELYQRVKAPKYKHPQEETDSKTLGNY